MTSLGPWFGGGGGRRFGDMDIWDPLSSFGLGDLIGGGRGRGSDDNASALAIANVDWRETDNAHIFRVDLPGAKKEEVKVEVEDDNILHISGKMEDEKEESSGDKWHRKERRYGSFRRRFRLPENANVEDIKCSLEHGVLTVNVPKKESHEAQKNVRQIDVS